MPASVATKNPPGVAWVGFEFVFEGLLLRLAQARTRNKLRQQQRVGMKIIVKSTPSVDQNCYRGQPLFKFG
jgi:hypothetical protein